MFCTILTLFYFFASSQVLYPLHPSIGDTIDVTEKLDYSLFTNSSNEGFKYATIQYINKNFTFIERKMITNSNGSTVLFNDSSVLTQQEIIIEQRKIQKVNSYYATLAKRTEQKQSIEVSEKKIPVRFTAPLAEQRILRTMRFCTFDETSWMSSFELGLRPTEVQLEKKP
jgi:hypothetical protein